MLLLIFQLWASTASADPRVLLQGNWQSCDEAERVYVHKVLRPDERTRDLALRWVPDWELHMGPRDEFGLYVVPGPDGPDHVHDGPTNLLAPAFHINDVSTWRNRRNWNIPSLHLWISIAAAGGSREQCDSFFVEVRKQ